MPAAAQSPAASSWSRLMAAVRGLVASTVDDSTLSAAPVHSPSATRQGLGVVHDEVIATPMQRVNIRRGSAAPPATDAVVPDTTGYVEPGLTARAHASALRLAFETVSEADLRCALASGAEFSRFADADPSLHVPMMLAIAREIDRRHAQQQLAQATLLKGPSDVAHAASRWLGTVDQEHFVAVGVDARQCVRIVRIIAIGSLAQVDVHPRELFRPMLLACAHSILILHNHPSGDPEPSEADLALTRRMVDVGKLLGVPVLDHLIIAGGRHVSLASRGLM